MGRMDRLAARYARGGGVLPTGARGRLDRERLPDPMDYYTGTAGLAFRERRGRWRTAACEFHGGSDSLRINTATGAFCCMACGVSGGDVLAYHMRLHGLDFVEAARQLGAWVTDGDAPLVPFNRRPAGLSAADALEVVAADAHLLAIETARAFRLGRIEEAVKDSVLAAAARVLAVIRGREVRHAV